MAHALHPTAGRRVAQHVTTMEGWWDGGLGARAGVLTEDEWLALVSISLAMPICWAPQIDFPSILAPKYRYVNSTLLQKIGAP